MNPIIVNNESYCQFTMNAITCPLPPQLHFHQSGITNEKRSQWGKMHRESKPKKGMVCLQIERPSPSINQRIALK